MRPPHVNPLAARAVAAACLACALLAPSGAGADAIGSWITVKPARLQYLSSAVFQPSTRKVFEFGGIIDRPTNALRSFTTTTALGWVAINPGGAPPAPRYGHVAVYDRRRDRMVVFGGFGANGALDDAYSLNLAGSPVWTALATVGTRPPASYLGSAIYDSQRDRILYFGGSADGYTTSSALWSLALATNTWTQLAPAGGPPSHRIAHSAVYDPVGDRMVVFGGTNGGGCTNDTWALALGSLTWTQLAPAGTPPSGRGGHAALFDRANNRMLVFGGSDGRAAANDLWALSLGASPTWTRPSPTGTPPGTRAYPRAVWDSSGVRMVLTSGQNGTEAKKGGVWTYALGASPAWATMFAEQAAPDGGRNSTLMFDAAGRRALVYDPTSLYRVPLDTAVPWTDLAPGGHPPDASFVTNQYTVVLDSLRARVIAHHGQNLDDGGLWTVPFGSTGQGWFDEYKSPVSGDQPSLVWDPFFDRFLRFGGRFGTSCQADLWTIDLGSGLDWQTLDVEGTPPPGRYQHAAVFDRKRSRMILLGGAWPLGVTDRTQVWSLDFTFDPPRWVQYPQRAGAPTDRRQCALAIDTKRDRLVLYGGHTSGGTAYGDVWIAPLADSLRWTRLTPTGTAPAPRYDPGAFYDPVQDRFVLFGGSEHSEALMAIQWSGVLVSDVEAEPGGAPALRFERVWPNPVRDGRVALAFTLPAAGDVALELFDVAGRRVGGEPARRYEAGAHSVTLDAGRTLGAGLYFVRLTHPAGTAVAKVGMAR